MKEKDNKDIHNNLYKLLKELKRVSNNNNLKFNLAYGTALGAVREKGFIAWDTDLDIMVTIDEYERFCSILELEMKEDFTLYTREKNKDYSAMFNRIGFKNVPHNELHIDIFPMVGAPKGKLKKRFFGIASYTVHLIHSFKNTKLKKIPKKASTKAKLLILICKILFILIPNKLLVYFYNKLKTAFPIMKSNYVYSISGPNPITGFVPKDWIINSELKKFEGLELPVPKEWDKYLTKIYGDYMTPRENNYYR